MSLGAHAILQEMLCLLLDPIEMYLPFLDEMTDFTLSLSFCTSVKNKARRFLLDRMSLNMIHYWLL